MVWPRSTWSCANIACWLFLIFRVCAGENEVVCVFDGEAQLRHGQMRRAVDSANYTQCSQMVYGWAHVDPGTFRLVPRYPRLEPGSAAAYDGAGAYRKFVETAQSFWTPAILAVGGEQQSSRTFSDMGESSSRRQNFYASILEALDEYGFDGILLDWRYPTLNGGRSSDNDTFYNLVSELREEMDSHTEDHKSLMVTMAAKEFNVLDTMYNLPDIAEVVDMLHVLTYDYHDSSYPQTWPIAPMSGDDELSVQATMDYYGVGSRQLPPKLTLALPLFGNSYRLSGEAGWGVASEGRMPPGAGTNWPGRLGMFEFTALYDGPEWHTGHNDAWQSDCYYWKHFWLTIETSDTITTKCQYAAQYGGVLLMSVDLLNEDQLDEITSFCAAPCEINNAVSASYVRTGRQQLAL